MTFKQEESNLRLQCEASILHDLEKTKDYADSHNMITSDRNTIVFFCGNYQVIERRIHIVYISCFTLLGVLSIWIAHLQIFKGFDYARKAFQTHYRRVEIPSRRGVIWDRNQRILAVSLACDSLCADPYLVADPERVAKEFTPQFFPDDIQIFWTSSPLPDAACLVAQGLSPEQADKVNA